MKLNPSSVDPGRLLKPTSVAQRLGVHPSMVTHWMQDDTLAYVSIDDVKFIPEEAVAVHEALRNMKHQRREARQAVGSKT